MGQPEGSGMTKVVAPVGTALGSGLGQATLGLLDAIPYSSDLSGVVLKGLHWLGGKQQQGRLEGHRPVRGPCGRGRRMDHPSPPLYRWGAQVSLRHGQVAPCAGHQGREGGMGGKSDSDEFAPKSRLSAVQALVPVCVLLTKGIWTSKPGVLPRSHL